jgi:DNA-3-methyladenine glycosylase II
MLTKASLAQGVALLAKRDPDLARILGAYGLPPLWARAPGFATLVRIILEQQVSLASARATYERLRVATAPLTPRSFLTLDDATLKRIGFSRQKTAYVRQLAQAVVAGELNLRALTEMDDDAVRRALLRLKGIGPWTIEVYLLMALRRPDAWPASDLGLLLATQQVKRLPARPTPAELHVLAEGWRPLRAVAARLLWHYYLSRAAERKLKPR